MKKFKLMALVMVILMIVTMLCLTCCDSDPDEDPGTDTESTEHETTHTHVYDEGTVTKDPTRDEEGIRTRTCTVCGAKIQESIEKLPFTYIITIDGLGKQNANVDGTYELVPPEKAGFEFIKWTTEDGEEFPSTGTVTEDVTVYPVYEIINTTTIEQLEKFAAGGAEKILIDADIVIDRPIFIVDDTVISAEKDVKLTRAPGYLGDIFVVGIDKNNVASVAIQKNAILTLDGSKGKITIDGNKDNITGTVVGSAIFLTDSGVVNMYDGITIANHYKNGNERAYISSEWVGGTWMGDRAGGAAVLILNGSFNMYGGVIENNRVRCERTIFTTPEGVESWSEDAGCGGAVYNCGSFNMYGGTIRNNEALFGGGIYNDEIVRLVAGTISGNKAYTKGGGVGSSVTASADMYIGTEELADEKMVFSNNVAETGGALYSNNNSPIVIMGNTQFKKNTSQAGGGAIYTAGALTVKGTLFEGNETPNSGGAIYFHYNYKPASHNSRRYLELTNCTFIENKSILGGAVALSASEAAKEKGQGAYAKVTDCTFDGNSANNCGAFYITRFGEAAITDTVFRNNQTPGIGGAVSVQQGCKLSATGVEFENNSAANAGALYLYDSGSVSLKDITFTENEATAGNGGALYFNAFELTLDSSIVFNGNTASQHGGAVYASYITLEDQTRDTAELIIDGAKFENNKARYGGAISARTESTVNIKNALFKDNSVSKAGTESDAGGGAIYSDFSTITIDNTSFDGCDSEYYGGSLWLYSCNTTVTSTEFENGNAAGGGAIYVSGGECTVEESNFEGNEATSGGAIYVMRNGNVKVDNSTFKLNKATSNGDGGAIYATKASITVGGSDTLFSQNTAKRGGAIYLVDQATVNATNGTFTSNSATEGGAISIRSNCEATFKLTSFTNNKVEGVVDNADGDKEGGGAIYAGWATLTLDGVTIRENNAADGFGGAVNANNSTLNVKGKIIISGNTIGTETDKPAGNIYLTPGKKITVAGPIEEGSVLGVTTGDGSFIEGDDFVNYKDFFRSDEGKLIFIKDGLVYIGTTTVTVQPSTFNDFTVEAVADTYKWYLETDTSRETVICTGATLTGAEDGKQYVCVMSIDGQIFESDVVTYYAKQTHPVCGANCSHLGDKAHEDIVYRPISTAEELKKAFEQGGNFYLACDIEISERLYVIAKTNLCLNGKILSAAEGVADLTMIKLEADLTITDCKETERVGYIDPENGHWTEGTYTGDGSATTVTLKGGIIMGGHGAWGGAVNVSKKDVSIALEIYNVNFVNNSATSNGGAIYVEGTHSIGIHNVNFVANSTTVDGGAFYLNGCTMTVDGNDTSFLYNSANQGGALYITNGASVNMMGGSFTGNTSSEGGAVNVRSGCTANFTSTEFDGNSATNGGAIYAADKSEVNLEDAGFTENEVTQNGGAIYLTGASMTAEGNNSFINNSAENYAGALYITSGATANMTGGTFTGNTAPNGGAVNLRSNCTATFTSTTFDGNTATNGGAIYAAWGTLNINNVTMTDNVATNGGHGGAVHSDNATINVNGGAFTNNSAANGGAIYFKANNDAPKTSTITGGEFKNNSATSGGAVYVDGPVTLTISGATFESNSATYGGAIGAFGISDVTVYNCTFTKNSAGESGDGGAIYAAQASVNINGNDTLFSQNSANRGGAIYLTNQEVQGEKIGSKLTMSGGSFEANVANTHGGAVSVRYACVASFESTVFDGNSVSGSATPQGGAVYDAGTLTLDSVTMTNNTAGSGSAIYVYGSVLNVKGKVVITDNSIALTDATNVIVVGALEAGSNIRVDAEHRAFAAGDGTNVTDVTDFVPYFTANEGQTVYESGGKLYAGHMHPACDYVCLHEGEGEHSGIVYTPISTAAELLKALNDGGNYYLTCDIEISSTLYVNAKTNLCLNGKILSATSGVTDFTMIRSYAALTITDCKETERVGYINPESRLWTEGTYTGEGDATAVTLKGGIIMGGHGGWAGAINTTAALEIYNVNFVNNKATSNGGAIYVNGAYTLDLHNVTFVANSAGDAGGAIGLSASTMMADGNTRFIGNTAVKRAGAIYLVSGASVNMTGGSFTGNTSPEGGAINLRTSCGVTFTSTMFDGNTSSYYGGAIYAIGDSTVTINNSTFTNNEATQDGGAIFAKQATVTISGSDTLFSYNSANRGGAIYLVKDTSGAQLTMIGGRFEGNTATDGGAVHSRSVCTLTFTSTVFDRNSATNGGAVFVSWANPVALNNVTMTNNTASNGGAVYSDNVTINVNGGSYNGNSATNGGVFYQSDSKAALTITGGEFKDNSAETSGKVAHVTSASAAITINCKESEKSTWDSVIAYTGTIKYNYT